MRARELHAIALRENGILDMRLHTEGGSLQWGIDEGCIHSQIGDAFYCIARDRSNKVVIMRGTGDDYCTARILSEFTDLDNDEANYRLIQEGRDILTNQLGPHGPVIFFLTEETLSAEDGMRYGFAHEVVAPEMLLNRARELAGHLASKSQFALRYTRPE